MMEGAPWSMAMAPDSTYAVVRERDALIAVRGESYGMASAIVYALNNPEFWEPSEACEVAESIRKRWGAR